jgi:hypothetical protein
VLQLRDLEGNIVATAEDSETATKLISTYNSTEFGVPQPGTAPPKYAWLGAEGVSSEPSQAAGASTQSGTSYVPEIGRALQTTSVESPGSFPNGTGGVGIVRAPYLGAAVNEFTETAVREEAASEEAKKTEAEARAYEQEGFCEKYASSSACHVDGPGEGNCEVNCLTVIGGGGGEGEIPEADPDWLLNESDAKQVAAVFIGLGNASEAVIVERLQKYLGPLGAEIAAQLGTSAFVSVGNQLDDCATTISYLGDETEDARCKLDLKFKLGWSQWVKFQVELCYTGEDKKKHPADYPYCTDE